MSKLCRYRGALGGGFGGCSRQDWTFEYFTDQGDADVAAEEEAKNAYEQYEGMHGLRSLDQIMDQDELDESEAEEVFNQERENWLDYESELCKPTESFIINYVLAYSDGATVHK